MGWTEPPSGLVNLRKAEADCEQPIRLADRPRARKAEPLPSHGIASSPWIVRRAVWKD